MLKYQTLIESWIGVKLNPSSKGEARMRCPSPDHEDIHPSCSVNCQTGFWHCFSCGMGGSIYKLAKLLGKTMKDNNGGDVDMDSKGAVSEIDKHNNGDVIQEERLINERKISLLRECAEFYHRQLINAKRGNLGEKYLISKRIARKMVRKHKIGLACKSGLKEYLLDKGYTLQECLDCGVLVLSNNEAVDAFKYSVVFPLIVGGKVVYLVARRLEENAKPKYLNIKGTIRWLYNEDILSNINKVIIAEGISDTLTLIQNGYHVVGALGAGLFKQEFKDKFVHIKTKYICYDNDLAGFKGMEEVDKIFDHDLKVIVLPEGIKDINEFFKDYETRDFNGLVKKAKWFVNYALDREATKEIHLIDVESSDNINKRVKVPFRVAGVGAAYFVPVRFRVYYKGNGDILQSREFVVPQNNVMLIKMCKESKDTQLKDLKRLATSCLGPSVKVERVEVLDYISITQIIALPKIKELKVGASGQIITEEGKEYRQKVICFQGVKNTTSKLYDAIGYVVADPNTSEARFLVSDYKEIREEFDNFRLTPEIIKQFESFKRKPNESIDEYLDKLAESSAYYFIRIFGEARKDAIIANLLCFHSPLYFYLEDEIVNGWLQIICIGDTTVGKSQIAKRIKNYTDVGVYVTGETCSRTGFLYAIDTKTLSSCILTWGLLPQQDRSLLIIDGANYISQDDWGTAREARRSGKLIVERVVKGEHPCRTRLILLANPSKPLSQYIYPIESIKDIYQEPDIARSDLCICFSGSDVPKEEINMSQEERAKPEMNMNQTVFQNSVFWAWSRKPEDIVIKEEVVKIINDVSNKLIDQFGSATDIPLISNDVKYKVARLAVALACLLHNTDRKHEKIIVTAEMVYMIQKFIERVYSAGNCKLDQYATDRKAATDISSDEFERIQEALLGEAKKDRSNILMDLIGLFRGNNIIRLNEISARLDRSDSTIKSKLVFFKRFGLIRSGKSGYAKTEKFIQFLNKLEQEKKALPPLPPYQKQTPS
ncbi:MAG: toprim domain-containing protein [Candidatus Omnitrophica bacterium]|nr:toprim domain-containing protein [Candidatus Omnitrophota bacterium]